MRLRLVVQGCVVALATMFWLPVRGQNISVDNAPTGSARAFVEEHLVGDGVYIFNVRFNGDNSLTPNTRTQIGTFDANGFVPLYMDSGVVMTTGKISVAKGPNNNEAKSTPATEPYVDNQVRPLLQPSDQIIECATLDFDFVSVSPFVTVNYCFGSEEYPQYVCSQYNDVFAFYITGPDPATGQTRTWNMASIPHTASTAWPDGIPVAINSVNDGVPRTSGNGSNCFYNFSQYYVENVWSQGVQYNGFTQKLAASANIMPCQQYHMHITICDIGDVQRNSGVFLEYGSLSSPMAQVNLSNGDGDTIVHSHPETVPVTVAGSDYGYGRATLRFGGTARVGEDYLCISSSGDTLNTLHNSVDISSADHTLTFVGAPGVVIEDTLTIEVAMQISLCPQYPALGTDDTLRFVLVEDDIVALKDTVIRAADTCRYVGVEVAYARRPLRFRWEPEDGIDHPDQQYSTAKIWENREYHVTAVDDMGNRGTATVSVIIGGDGVEEPQRGGIAVYPNPTDGLLHVEATGMREVRLVSAAGVCVYSRRCDSDRVAIDTAPYAEGIYVLQVTTTAGRHETPVVVQ